MSIRNTQAGSGWQNNNTHSGTQNINFVNNYNPAAPNPHKTLWEAIAGVGASHKAEHQFLRGACLEGTRERALGAISDWASAKNPGAPPIYWLSGAAGVGKSAIALTIAKSFEAMALLASSFFFFRSDPRRNNPSALMLTIAHAPATITPLMRNPIEQKISADPTILEANLEEQFRVLVLVPSLAWSKQRALWGAPVVPNIIIIDGLDECGDEDIQMRILSIIKSAYEHEPPLPLRFLICSRPEAWLREAFAAEPLHTLSNFIVLDDTFMPDKDIQRYYLHHFQDIVSSAKYSHVQFPDPWPSKRDLEILVERSCGQFVHAATVIKFIMLAYNHPIEQLRIILDGTSKRKLSKSPYHDLDCLYHVILNANPDHEQLIPILAAILVLPDYSTASPAIIEQVLGLPSGQVALTLRGMYSVLNIRGPKDRIELYHTSFEEYLVDHTRSCEFHVDLPARKHTIAHCWLRSLTMDRLRSLSDGQIYNKKRFDGLGWVDLCTSIPQPTRNLLHDLWNVDLANVFLLCPHDESRITYRWNDLFEELVLWLEKYPRGVAIGHDQTSKIDGGDVYEHDMRRYCHAKSPNPDHSSHRVADGWNDLNLMEAQMHRLRNLPRCFHVEWRPGAELQLEIVCWVVECATECQCSIKLGTGTIDWTQQPVLLSECHCDPCGEHGSHNPEHVAYQDACMQYAKALNSMFAGMIARGERENQEAASRGTKLEHIFLNLVDSALLKHCHLGTELISLCHTFLELVKACPSVLDRTVNLELDMDIMKGKANLLEWIESFPKKFAEEGKVLKAQALALPWDDDGGSGEGSEIDSDLGGGE